MNRRLEEEIANVRAGQAGVDAPTTASASPRERRPLYGHTSEATAYLVDGYPYGYREKTQIRYWLEHKPKKGWRFVSQTKNPKTGSWNQPKPSTYADWGAAMYLDDQGHVQWTGVGQYSSSQDFLSFVRSFPGADLSVVRKVAPAKLHHLRAMLSGEQFFTINGVRQEQSPADIERLRGEVMTWEEIARIVR